MGISLYTVVNPYRNSNLDFGAFSDWCLSLNWWFIIPTEIHVPSISFHSYFIQAFEIVIDSWKFSMLLLYILWDDWQTFMISWSNYQLQQELEYTLLKPGCHNWWISKMQSGREDTLEERYAIQFCFKLWWNATETYGMIRVLLEHLAWIEHHFLSGIRDSRKAGSLWGMMRRGGSKEVNTAELYRVGCYQP